MRIDERGEGNAERELASEEQHVDDQKAGVRDVVHEFLVVRDHHSMNLRLILNST